LYAGAAFQGAKLKIDENFGAAVYQGTVGAEPLGPQRASTPSAARRFLLALDQATLAPAKPVIAPAAGPDSQSEALTFPLAD
jgi:hypothetical protein